MAPPVDDFTFVMLCLKHLPEKITPDFDAVAKEAGTSTSAAAYKRLWNIKKKYGLPTNQAGGGTSKASCVSTPATGGGTRKRGRPAKTAPKPQAEESKKEEEEQSEARPEPEAEDESDEQAESPIKKTKGNGAEDSEAAGEEIA